jgi:hypothetical protein
MPDALINPDVHLVFIRTVVRITGGEADRSFATVIRSAQGPVSSPPPGRSQIWSLPPPSPLRCLTSTHALACGLIRSPIGDRLQIHCGWINNLEIHTCLCFSTGYD